MSPFPKCDPMLWTWNQIACQFKPPPENLELRKGARLAEKQRLEARNEDWFWEGIKRDHSTGAIKFECYPPRVSEGRREKFRILIQDMLDAYDLLYLDSAEKTAIQCYINMTKRDLLPAILHVPAGWDITQRFREPYDPERPFRRTRSLFLGAQVVGIPSDLSKGAVLGAFTDETFCQYEPLPYDPELWAWHSEGPEAIKARFL